MNVKSISFLLTLVLLLTVGKPGLVGAVLLAVRDFHLTLEVAVLIPGAGYTRAIAFFGTASAVVVKYLPGARLFSLTVVTALLVDLSIGMPPGPVSNTDVVVVHHAFNRGMLLFSVVELLVFHLPKAVVSKEESQEERYFFQHDI